MSEFGASVVCCLFVAEGEILPPHTVENSPPSKKKDVLPEEKKNSSHPLTLCTATGAPAIASDEINEHGEGKYQSSEKQ